MNLAEIKTAAEKFLVPNYGTRQIALARGEGPYVWDIEGVKYLDMLGGIAVCVLGHSHPVVAKAIAEQAGVLTHISNLYLHPWQVQLAQLLVENSFADKIFFCNSGAEANEAALKLAKKYAQHEGNTQRYEVISLWESFHGRTIATLSATGQSKYHEGFKPLLPGFTFVPRNDITALMDAVTDHTCAIMLELIQGEAGVNPLSEEYVKAVRELCSERDITLIIDEVQTGMGRTGTLWAYQQYGIMPDIMTTAKGLGNGFPIAAMMTTTSLARTLGAGSHGCTFGGGPLACAAALATLKTILSEDLPGKAANLGGYFIKKLKTLKKDFKVVKEIRGRGLMVGLELEEGGQAVFEGLLERRILANCVAGKTIRFLPPLIITEQEIDLTVEAIREILQTSAS